MFLHQRPADVADGERPRAGQYLHVLNWICQHRKTRHERVDLCDVATLVQAQMEEHSVLLVGNDFPRDARSAGRARTDGPRLAFYSPDCYHV